MGAEQFGFRERRSSMKYIYRLVKNLKTNIASKDLCEDTFYDLDESFDPEYHDSIT